MVISFSAQKAVISAGNRLVITPALISSQTFLESAVATRHQSGEFSWPSVAIWGCHSRQAYVVPWFRSPSRRVLTSALLLIHCAPVLVPKLTNHPYGLARSG